MKLLKISMAFCLSLCFAGILLGQDKSEVKIIVVEKAVDSEGNETTKKMIKEGAEARKHMKEKKMELHIEKDVKYIKKEVEVENRGSESRETKKIMLKIKDEDGKVKIFDFDGEGEMPEEMKKYMDEGDIDIDIDEMESGERDVEVEIKEIKEGDMEEEEIEDLDINEEGAKKIRLKIIEDGEVKIFELDGEGEIPEGVKKIMEDEGIDIDVEETEDGEMKVMVRTPKDKARLGIVPKNHVDGVEIVEVIEGSAAEKAGLNVGDVIYEIAGKTIGSGLQLSAGLDKVKEGELTTIGFIRDGANQKVQVKL